MDRSELSETIVHELGALFEAEVRAAGPVLVAADLDGGAGVDSAGRAAGRTWTYRPLMTRGNSARNTQRAPVGSVPE